MSIGFYKYYTCPQCKNNYLDDNGKTYHCYDCEYVHDADKRHELECRKDDKEALDKFYASDDYKWQNEKLNAKS